MKFRSLSLIAFLALSFSACKEETDHTAQIEQMSQQIFAKYPGTAAVTINIDDRTTITFTLGGQQIYKTSEARRAQMANELGVMAIQVLGKDNGLRDGELVLTKDEHNLAKKPADGIATAINMDSLNKIAH